MKLCVDCRFYSGAPVFGCRHLNNRAVSPVDGVASYVSQPEELRRNARGPKGNWWMTNQEVDNVVGINDNP